ncbi:MAG: transposase [Anaerolineae bacterium]|nr:transposase [Anaerolineae bacterium]
MKKERLVESGKGSFFGGLSVRPGCARRSFLAEIENLPAKYFVGLALDEKAPDHSTLTVFRERLVQRGKLKVFEDLLEEVVQTAVRKGIQFGSIQIVDSAYSAGHVKIEKDERRQKKGKPQRDADAEWGVKHKRTVKSEEGQSLKQSKYFYGYKAHMGMNAQNKLITSLEMRGGGAYDGHHFCGLVKHDLEQGLPVATYAADKGYDSGDNHFYLELHGLHSAIRLKRARRHKKDANKEIWLDLEQTKTYQQGLKDGASR